MIHGKPSVLALIDVDHVSQGRAMARVRVLDRLLDVLDELWTAHPYGGQAMELREKGAALTYQLLLHDAAPEPELEHWLSEQRLLLRPAPQNGGSDPQEDER